jgi:hypothetical protein
MTASAAVQPDADSTEEIAKHSSVGMLVEKIDKAIKRNPAMPVGELWQWHLKALLTELHKFHLDYTEDAVEEAGGGDEGYEEALVDFVVDAKELIMLLTSLLMGSYGKQGFLDARGQPIADKLSTDEQKLFLAAQDKLAAWTDQYPNLIEEQLADLLTPTPAPEAPGETA